MPAAKTAAPEAEARLVLDLADIGQLVAVDAVWPMRPRSLRPDAEAAILDWARCQPRQAALAISIGLPKAALGAADAVRLETALPAHFGLLAEAQRRDAQEYLIDAQKSVVLGLAILGACITTAWWIAAELPERPLTRVLRESIGILGWVAMWKPVEMLLHDRRAIVRRLGMLRRLAAAEVRVVPARTG